MRKVFVMRNGKLTPLRQGERLRSGGKTNWPIYSRGAGVHLSQIDEMERAYPGHRFCRKTGRAIFESASHRKKCLRDRGFIDLDGNWSGRHA